MYLVILIILFQQYLWATPTHVVTNERGSFVEEFSGAPYRIYSHPLDDPQIVWMRNLETGVFNSTAMTSDIYCYTGSMLNAPRQASQYLIDGNETPLFFLDGTEWEVAANNNGSFWAGIDRGSDNFCTLYLVNGADNQTLWSYSLGNGYVAGSRGFQFSDSGNMLAVWFGRANNEQPTLFAWDMSNPDSTPEVSYTIPTGLGISARAMGISRDGNIIGVTADNHIHVYEVSTNSLRDEIPIDASTDGFALSADGEYVMDGFQNVHVRHWNGTIYQIAWTYFGQGRYVSQLLLSPDNTYAVSCWYNQDYNRNQIRVHNMTNGQTRWSYLYRQGTNLQDWPTDVDISADGDWFAVGSWGDESSANGEVCVFSRYYSAPYFELDMPGSCYSLDLSQDGEHLIAGGKHVHANVFGNGGDAMVVDLDLPTTSIPQADSAITYPNLICSCRDTVTIPVRIWNIGYSVLQVNGLAIQIIPDDGGVFDIDAGVLPHSIEPSETLRVNLHYHHCLMGFPINAGPYRIFWVTDSDTLRTDIAPLNVLLCTAESDNADLQPLSFTLSSYPNPFNSETRISFSLTKQAAIKLNAYSIDGRLVERIAEGSYEAGEHEKIWSPSNLATGIYFLRLESRFGVQTQKLVYLR